MSIVLCSAAASWPKQVSPGMATAISISLSTTKTITSCAAAPGAVTANIVGGGRGGPGRSASRSRIWALSRICTALRRIDGPPRAQSHGSERLDKSLDRLGDGAPQDCLVGKQLELGTLGGGVKCRADRDPVFEQPLRQPCGVGAANAQTRNIGRCRRPHDFAASVLLQSAEQIVGRLCGARKALFETIKIMQGNRRVRP